MLPLNQKVNKKTFVAPGSKPLTIISERHATNSVTPLPSEWYNDDYFAGRCFFDIFEKT
jgi:hypothetical protein